jgi:hypothetical protein
MAQHNEFQNWDQIFRRLRQTQGLPFSDLLPAERVARILDELNLPFRNRIYTPPVTLWMFLSQVLSADHSCRETVARLLAWRSAQGLSACSADTTSYCEARQRLPLELMRRLTRETGAQAVSANWLWKERHVKLGDGTSVTMPDTAANQKAYPRRRNQPRSVGFPIMRVMFVVSLACGTVLDVATGPMRGKKTGENTLLRTLHGVLEAGDILLVDRLFGGYRELATCRERGVDVLVRQHQTRRTDFRRGRWLGTLDHVVRWQRPKFEESGYKWRPPLEI